MTQTHAGLSDRLVTVFGGGGFLGRYAVQELLKAGARVRIAQRDPRAAWFLKPQGGLGQTQFVAVDIRRKDSVARALGGSDAVVNLVGAFQDMDALQAKGAGTIAAEAASAGVAHLVHISAIGADPASPSAYGRTKGEGEDAVRAAFPAATILRPSIVFGREDQFTNRFAGLIRTLPVVPVIRGGALFQPVFVADVARAIRAALEEPSIHARRTYWLGGPERMSMAEINRRIAEWTGRARRFVAMPDSLAAAMARFGGWAPGAPMTWDQWLMLQHDTVMPDGEPGLAALGVTPTPMGAVAPEWLVPYRRHGRFGGVKAA